VTALVCNFILVLLYVVICCMGIMIARNDSFENMTIYTQAISEWTTPGWLDFKWSVNDACPSGYEPIGNEWLGTLPGASSGNGVKPVSSSSSSDIPAHTPVKQYKMFPDM